MIVVILAGGSGQRLWPLSTMDRPKQFIKIWDNLSLFQKTILRYSKKVEEILVVTALPYQKMAEEQIKELKLKNKIHILLEPKKKNTAPAIILAIKFIEERLKKEPNTNILVTPSDHYISSDEMFLKTLDKIDLKPPGIITFGIPPVKPEVGYGYIKVKNRIDSNLFLAEKFIEKPSYKRAKRFLSLKNMYWNMGLFFFTIETFLKELSLHMKREFKLYQKGYEKLLEDFDLFPDISIDYALMEKLKSYFLCPLDLDWSDLGVWDNLHDILEKDKSMNVISGDVFAHNTENSLLISAKRKILTFDVKDLIIIETEDAVLIGKRGSSHKLKMVLAEDNKSKISSETSK